MTRQRTPYEQGFYDGYRGDDLKSLPHPDDAVDYKEGYSDGALERSGGYAEYSDKRLRRMGH